MPFPFIIYFPALKLLKKITEERLPFLKQGLNRYSISTGVS